ncbi:hypothetical protein BDV96DRAFT_589580 [Lophiotrema nucula]|uniref:Uncharacterized protein n=1 Tax=Lophiotrema nucula TaxID=690887 RepID=A0A6A5YLY9_9PLEO|nr:hypothetical protein BDV96DRAFT_589580 [Lophiotrema nucula]
MQSFSELPWVNRTAATLHHHYDISARIVPSSLQTITGCTVTDHPFGEGTVIHVRVDKKPLLPEHLEYMIDFYKQKLYQQIVRAADMEAGEGKEAARQEILDLVTEENFKNCYREWQGRRREYRSQIN